MDGDDRPDVTAHSTFSDVEAAGRTEEGGGYDGRWPRERGPTTRQVRRGVNLCLFLILAGCVAFEAVRWSSPSPSSDEGAAALGEGSDGLDEDAGTPPPPRGGEVDGKEGPGVDDGVFQGYEAGVAPSGMGRTSFDPLGDGEGGSREEDETGDDTEPSPTPSPASELF